jgi:signal transduction histidine kinase
MNAEQSTPEVSTIEKATSDGEIERLRADLQHRERQIHAIRRITNALFSHPLLDDMVRETLTVAIEVLEADVGSLQLHDPETDTLVFRFVKDPTAVNLVGLAIPTSRGIGGRVFRSGIPERTEKVAERADFNSSVDDMTGYRTESMLTAPIKRLEGPPLGVMQILNSRRRFDERDLEVLEVLCAQAAAAIETARLAQEARKAEIVNVLGDISHDIKNMLTPIQSGVMTLLPLLDETFESLEALSTHAAELESWRERVKQAASLSSEDYRWILENALDSADKVQARTREIADAVKGETSPPHFEEADINQTAREVSRLLRPVAEAAHLNLRLDLDFEVPLAEFDRKQMYNALYNLVNNAIPETPQGGSITIRTRAPREGSDALTVEVQDTGGGMSEEVRARLFTDQAISTKPGGTGLGTRIVAGVVRRHGANITVESEAGCGSTFSISLPLRQNAESA